MPFGIEQSEIESIRDMLRKSKPYKKKILSEKKFYMPTEVYRYYRDKICQIEYKKRNLNPILDIIYTNNLRLKADEILVDLYFTNNNSMECIKDVKYKIINIVKDYHSYNIGDIKCEDDVSSLGLEKQSFNYSNIDMINYFLNQIDEKRIIKI